MSRSALLRRAGGTLVLALALAAALTACSGEDPEAAPSTAAPTTATTSAPTTATSSPSESPTATSPGSPTGTGTPLASPEPGGTATPLGRDAAALAQLLPLGFPIPPELTIIGDPTATADNANVAFTVPSGADAFVFYRTELPAAGFELLPGTSEVYSPEVASGAIIARGDGYDVNLLVVEDDVELTLTRTQ